MNVYVVSEGYPVAVYTDRAAAYRDAWERAKNIEVLNALDLPVELDEKDETLYERFGSEVSLERLIEVVESEKLWEEGLFALLLDDYPNEVGIDRVPFYEGGE